MTPRDDVYTPTIAVAGFLGAIVLFAIIVLLQAVFYRVGDRLEAERQASDVPVALEEMRAAQRAELEGYEVDAKTRSVRIPIDRAMELVVAQYSANGDRAKSGLESRLQPAKAGSGTMKGSDHAK